MNKTLAAALATAAVFVVGGAQAQTNGSIQIKGTVATVCTVAVTDIGASLNITGGETNKPVGTIVETCNSGSGYRVTVSSSNAGSLKNGNSAITYQLNYDGQSGGLSGPMTVERSAAASAKQVQVGVTVPATANAISGTYSDTLTISIAAC